MRLADLELPVSDEEALRILHREGFRVMEVDTVGLVRVARTLIGRSVYKREASLHEAPHKFDCSGFVKWLYAEQDIWLPRLAVQQREYGEAVDVRDVVAGDLLFFGGGFDFYRGNQDDGVSHVGMATGQGTIIHASYWGSNGHGDGGVSERPFGQEDLDKEFRGVRRIISKDVLVVAAPRSYVGDIETSDDIRWVVMKSILREEQAKEMRESKKLEAIMYAGRY